MSERSGTDKRRRSEQLGVRLTVRRAMTESVDDLIVRALVGPTQEPGASAQLIIRAVGAPAKKGSKSPMGHMPNGRCILVESDKKLPAWSKAVAAAARNAVLATGWLMLSDACEAWLTFYLPRPKTVDRELPTGRGDGDGDKMVRAALDALSGIVYVDDALVTDHHCRQRYCEPGQPAGARIVVRSLAAQGALV